MLKSSLWDSSDLDILVNDTIINTGESADDTKTKYEQTKEIKE